MTPFFKSRGTAGRSKSTRRPPFSRRRRAPNPSADDRRAPSARYPAPMRLATWNVNSVRTRVDRIIAFLKRENIDALAMQETKCKPEQFLLGAFADAG